MAKRRNDKKAPTEESGKTPEEHPDALHSLTAQTDGSPSRFGARLRNYFLTGLLIVGPLGITAYVIWWFITLIDAWVKPWIPPQYLPEAYLPFTVPGVGLVISITALMFIGATTANLFGRTVVSYGEMMLDRMPVVRNVYGALKQIFETVLSQSTSSFQKVGLIEYPRKGLYAVVFISTQTKGEIDDRVLAGEGMLSVFLPTTPNPTSGFLLFVPEKDVLILDMTVEEAAKLVISAGLVVPPYQAKLKKLADEAKAHRPRVPQKEPAE